MPHKQKKQSGARVSRRCKPPQINAPPEYQVEMACPICKRRAFDISNHPIEPICVGLKCPNCNNIIHVPCTPSTVLNNMDTP